MVRTGAGPQTLRSMPPNVFPTQSSNSRTQPLGGQRAGSGKMGNSDRAIAPRVCLNMKEADEHFSRRSNCCRLGWFWHTSQWSKRARHLESSFSNEHTLQLRPSYRRLFVSNSIRSIVRPSPNSYPIHIRYGFEAKEGQTQVAEREPWSLQKWRIGFVECRLW